MPISVPRPADQAQASSLRLRAFTEGSAAFASGLPLDANPHAGTPDAERWEAGWTCARNVRDAELADVAAEVADDFGMDPHPFGPWMDH